MSKKSKLPSLDAMAQLADLVPKYVNRRANGTPYRRAKGTPCQDGGALM
jgi:hypothetical protein